MILLPKGMLAKTTPSGTQSKEEITWLQPPIVYSTPLTAQKPIVITINTLTHKKMKALNLGLNKFGKISIAICLDSNIAIGAPTKTIHTIRYLEISSDQVSELFKM
jgi:hypothetical protein